MLFQIADYIFNDIWGALKYFQCLDQRDLNLTLSPGLEEPWE